MTNVFSGVCCSKVPLAAERLCKYYGDGPLLIISEVRLNETGITTHLQECFQVTYWPSSEGKDNLLKASKANIGMTCVRLTAWCSSLPQSKGTPSVCFPVLFYIKNDYCQMSRNWPVFSASEYSQGNNYHPVLTLFPDHVQLPILNSSRW